MNSRILLAAEVIALSGFTGAVLAQDTTVQAVPYHYGMPLHIAEVVALTEPQTMVCQVITAQMDFIDTSGQLQAISYSKLSDACSYQN